MARVRYFNPIVEFSLCEYHKNSYYRKLEIKIFGLVLEFKMSFQQQQHSFAFMLLYSDLPSCWDQSFLTEGHSSNLIGPLKGFLRL